MRLGEADTKKLQVMLDKLALAIEELLLTGLTTVSESTIQTLNVSFQEASRSGLLRLGSTLKVACEELTRFTRDQPDFSGKRFSFFLNRAWLITRGLSHAIKENDSEEFERLTWNAANNPVGDFEAVTLGVSKKFVPGAFCAFEFRLRALSTAGGGIEIGQPLIWSFVFPVKANMQISAESFLHLPQKQNFVAHNLLEGNRIIFQGAAITLEKSRTSRISLNDKSGVLTGEKFEDWSRFVTWSPEQALIRLNEYEPGPLDLDIELQEEVFIDSWEPRSELSSRDTSQLVYPIFYNNVPIDMVVSRGVDGDSLKSVLEKAIKAKKRPTIYGLMHYEKQRLTLQPLSFIAKSGPEYVTLSKDKVDRVALLRALNLKGK